MERNKPVWLRAASGLMLIGEDGVTERTGDSNRPVDIWLAKGPNWRTESATALTMNFTTTFGSLPLPAK